MSLAAAAARLVLAVTLAVFVAHIWGYFFLLDDFALIREGSTRTAMELLRHPLFNFYRPAEHVWIKLLFHFFGWIHPGGYVAASLALHVCSSWLVTRLAQACELSGRTSWVAGLLFLLSPWATEPYFWMSAGFDLIATLAMLAALVCGLRDTPAVGGPKPMRMAAGFAAAAVALLAKETAVAVAPLFIAGVVFIQGPRGLARRRIATYAAGLLVLTAVYLAVRERMLPSLGGGYGTLASLVRSSSPASNAFTFVRAYLVFPLPHLAVIPFVFVAVAVLLIAIAAIERPPVAALAVIAMAASLAPIVWLPLNAGSSAANRFLYFGGAWLSLLLAAGTERLKAVTRGAVLALVVGVALGSVAHQARIWREASRLSRSSIDQLRPFAGSTQPLFVTNLPWEFTDGPYVLNEAALRYYFQGGLPPFRARAMAMTFDRPESTLAFWPDDGRDLRPAAGERVVTLTLPIWVPEPRPEGGIDEPAARATVEEPFTIRGWALDANAREHTGIDAVRIYAYPEGGGDADVVFLGAAAYGESRPDVASRFGRRFGSSGFRLRASGLRAGRYRLVVNPRDHLTRRTERPLEIQIVVR